ncbi:imidazolonepropionase [Planctomycetes bacterium Poly30]|uniref:Imidazolonepropionase n=1 Tax=Saltatorellus ferox TaxID=2528018 RepID=A0A518ESX3_9BACT|nr:imidazolonepropionase [Planctomycetes bacterium Poly30]
MTRSLFVPAALCVAALGVAYASAPSPASQDAPLRGPRKVDPRWHALVGGTVIPEPGRVIENATIVIRDGVIESVVSAGEAPEGARIWDCSDLIIHAGFIESYVGVEAPRPEATAQGGYWQTDLVVPQRSALDGGRLDGSAAKDLRSVGFTAAALAPEGAILGGTAAVVAVGSEESDFEAASSEVLEGNAYQSISFRTAGWGSDGVLSYPTSEMGAIALLRQAFADADRYQQSLAVDALQSNGHEPPQPSGALQAIAEAGSDRAMMFVSRGELQTLRAAKLASELGRSMIVKGTGTEFRRLDAVASLGLPMVVPVAFPEAPDVSTPEKAAAQSLRDLWGWEEAPSNLARLAKAGVTVALTSEGLEKRSEFPGAVRKAMERGFTEEEALRALTITPAKLLGVDDRLGRVAPGMLAHLVVREGQPFAKDGKIRDVWVGGKRFAVNKATPPSLDGTYAFEIPSFGSLDGVTGEVIVRDRKTLEFRVGERIIEAKKVNFGPFHVHFHLVGKDIEEGLTGIFSGSGLFEGESIHGTLANPDGTSQFWTAKRTGDAPAVEKKGGKEGRGAKAADEADSSEEVEGDAEAANPEGGAPEVDAEEADEETAGEGDEENEADEEADANSDGEGEKSSAAATTTEALRKLPVPFGAYGRHGMPEARTVIFKGATVWTSADAGIVEGAVVVIEDGKIRYVGPAEFAPKIEGAEEFDATGLHITPGLIDCHSHTGISGGVNEVGRRVTSEVRVADVIDPDDMNFYRQLAGGLTAANQLHGSANAIGGQNSVVKLRWGVDYPDQMIAEGAMPGIKFALGENPKRVAAGTDQPDEYPTTRMGVEALIRDRLVAGKEYREEWERYERLSGYERRSTMPPQVNLELQALGEIVAGERWIHSHSYRQDEILMLGRLAQEFGFKIGTFQHVLEGYKVADAIAESAVGASTFSDWWAYKFEVIDAIPHNAAIMASVGVNVSINSDSDEHARRLNTEAAKAMKYGGMSRAEALKLVTLNPAIQLGLGDLTGSLEAGKDADLAIWSGDPLSYASRCVSTWVDGAELFSAEEDRMLRKDAEAERQRIIQKILEEGLGSGAKGGGRGRGKGPVALDASSMELDELRDQMEALWRSGVDPSLARPGVCGCFDVLFEEAAARAARNR